MCGKTFNLTFLKFKFEHVSSPLMTGSDLTDAVDNRKPRAVIECIVFIFGSLFFLTILPVPSTGQIHLYMHR